MTTPGEKFMMQFYSTITSFYPTLLNAISQLDISVSISSVLSYEIYFYSTIRFSLRIFHIRIQSKHRNSFISSYFTSASKIHFLEKDGSSDILHSYYYFVSRRIKEQGRNNQCNATKNTRELLSLFTHVIIRLMKGDPVTVQV